MQAIQGEMLEILQIGTSYGRVRCLMPRQIEQMKASLTAHGQLTALVVVKRQCGLELIDGFKRHRAAEQMGWTTLRVTSMDVDEQGQWAAMLALNRATHSLSVLEESLVLREMMVMGMTQTQIGQELSRHKSWVSRRIGLIERLHPELVEQIREGILPPGAARRLLSLPAGNQLEMATVVMHHGLGSQETELFVRLWKNADPPVRDYLLAHPREALANARAGGYRGAAGSAPDAAGTTAAASPSDPAGSGSTNPADAATKPCGGRPADPGRRPGIDEVVALPPDGGARFRKTAQKLKAQKRSDRDEQILSLLAQGYRNKAIARKLGIDVKTVRRVRKGAKKRKPRASKLDVFKPVIQELVVKKDLTAIRVLREIRALGYQGGYSVLKEYARSIRRRSRRRPHLRFETEKGKQGQVDLSDYTVDFRGQATEVVCFSMVFGYSRWQFIRFTEAANAHSVCHSHVLAFEKAGGAPHEILYDRMKQVVLESYADRVVFHPLFAALAKHYGFKAIPLAPGYKEGKGKVENAFKFVYSGLLKGSTFHDLEDLNRKAEVWLRDVAWVRKHGTTQERPLDRMDEERPYLIPLPARPFVAARIEERLVGYDFCIAWDTNRYSVSPSFVGRSVKAMALDGILDIYLEGEIIARHQLRQTHHRRYILPEHESEFRQHSTSRHVLQEQFLRLGEIAQSFADGLIKAHGGAAGYHISEILKLADQVGVPRVLEALRHAARYGAFSHTSVARIVRGKQPARQRASSFPSESPPKNVAEYLKASGHKQRSLEHYERLLKEKARKPGKK